jgi:hypothetical protein
MPDLSLSADGEFVLNLAEAAPVEDSNIPNLENVAAPVQETPPPAPEQGQPTAPTQFTHGMKLENGMLVLDPNAPVDITQLESGRKLQKTLSDVQRELATIRAEKAEAAKVQTEAQKTQAIVDLRTSYADRIRNAKTPAEQARLYGEFKDKESDLKVANVKSELDSIQQTQEQATISEALSSWNDYVVENGFDPALVNFINQVSYQQANGDPLIFHERRQSNLLKVVVEYNSGRLKKSPFIQQGQGQPAPQAAPAAPTAPVSPPGLPPIAGAPGQVDGIQLLLGGQWDRLEQYRNNR